MEDQVVDIITEPMDRNKPIGARIDRLQEIRVEKARLNSQIKQLNEVYSNIEKGVLEEMEHLEIDKASGATASVTYKIETYAGVEDIEAFLKWVMSNGSFEFVQKRVNSAPVKAMYEIENELPDGIGVHTEPKLNIRKKTKVEFA